MTVQYAYVKKIDKIIEEEVHVVINEIDLVLFVTLWPESYTVKEGETYPVELDITVLDDLELEELKDPTKELIRKDNLFEYEIKGRLNSFGVLDAGVLIESEDLKEYEYLYGKYIRIKADRITAEFLEPKAESEFFPEVENREERYPYDKK